MDICETITEYRLLLDYKNTTIPIQVGINPTQSTVVHISGLALLKDAIRGLREHLERTPK